MTFVATRYEHVVLDAAEVPRIAGTTMKVTEPVLARQAYGWSPEELHFQYPHLSLGAIHSALAYYWDHQAALDADIGRRVAAAEAAQQSNDDAELHRRLQTRNAG
ncbi:MAG TPA: DUF433 domain-containing protein [Chloroflexia bacterium]|nr:DUF433 domain-containing protein [Chloroflexia bacterium]